ncbi:MAG: Tex family protein [Anaerolineae bacterium]|jgi:uncharacterized protein
MDFAAVIAAELGIGRREAAATIALFDEGNTLPFIARYRKEQTGMLDEQQLRRLKKAVDRLRTLENRRQTIIASIEKQGTMTPELRKKLLAADSLTELEDLYRPYKPKRRTRADVAREKGLQGLADLILEQIQTDSTVEQIVKPFLTDEVPTVEDALAGARDIVAQSISDDPNVRQLTRDRALRSGVLHSERKDADDVAGDTSDPRGTYQLYYEFKLKAARLRPHQILAINRGEAESVLRARVEVPERDWRAGIASRYRPTYGSPLDDQLMMAVEDAAQRLLLPAIERDVRRNLTERAEAHAVRVFADNLRALLNQPPLAGHIVLGIDPGFRTGCKVAVVDRSGKVVGTGTIYPHPPQSHWDEAFGDLKELVEQHSVTLIAIGNGTASRETEQLAAELIRDVETVRYLMVDETGASVYSASVLARAELPDLDVSLRGAVSIARRVQDPLAELVKIDPRSLGVGMYQHDINQRELEGTLDEVVESVVNSVGVDLNSASPALLTHVSGIGPTLAERIVAYRDSHGPFADREAIKAVPGIGPKTFEQAAGFLRIREGENPLDASAIHPESYDIAEAVLDLGDLTSTTPPAERAQALVSLLKEWPVDELASELEVGAPTLADILKQLVQPGRDPRQDLPAPILRREVLKLEDLTPHLRLKGTVRNAVDFGCFVDIGVKNDGLLHRSQIPADQDLQVGDVIEVEILKVEPDRGRISLGWPKP